MASRIASARGWLAAVRAAALAACVATAWPAPGAAQDPESPQSWRWVSFGSSSGLPSQQIASVVRTRDGTMWAGTDRGVAWFDGYRWHPVAAADGHGRMRVRALAPDAGGGIVVVVDSAVFRGDTAGLRPVPLRLRGQPMDVLRVAPLGGDSLLVLDEQRLYACSGDGSCAPLRGEREGLRGSVSSLWVPRPGRVWAVAANGLFERRGGSWTLRLPSGTTQAFAGALAEGEDGSGVVALNQPFPRGGIYAWGGADARPREQALPRMVVSAAAVGPRGEMAVAHSSTSISVREGGVWSTRSVPASVGAIRSLSYSAGGDLWVGGAMGLYLYRASSQLWWSWRAGAADPRNRVNAILVARNGSIWLGAGRGVEVLRPDGSSEWVREAAGVALPAVTALGEDSAGGIWVATGAAPIGAFRWDGRSWRRYGQRDGLGALRIHRIARDRRGRLWFLGLGGTFATRLSPGAADQEPGAYVLDGGRFVRWSVAQGLPSGRVYAFSEGRDGALWFGTVAGMSRYLHGTWRHWIRGNGLQEQRVFALAVDSANRTWFSDQVSGLGWLDAQERAHYLGVEAGLPSTAVWDVAAAPDGAVWVTTEGGLARCDDAGCVPFHQEDGLSSLELWPVVPTRDRVYVGTLGTGLDVLDLRAAGEHDVRIEIHSTRDVGSDRPGVHWHADGFLGWPPSGRIATRYRLDGGAWSLWGTDRAVAVGDMRFGRHRITVQGRDWLGSPSGGDSLAFSVPLPLYLRPPVAIPVALLLATSASLAAVLVARRRRYEAEQRVAVARMRRLAAAVEQAGDGVAITDRLGAAEFVNASFEAITGWRADELVGRLVRHLPLDAADTAYFSAVASAIERGEEWEGEGEGRRKDGAPYRAYQRVTPLRDGSGAVTHLLWLVRDVTSEAKVQAGLLEAHKLEAVGQLTGGIAHDFNNLLAVVLANSTLVAGELGEEAPQHVRQSLEDIVTEATRGAELVSQLLAFGRRRRLVVGALEVRPIVEETAAALRPRLPAGVTIEVRVDPDVVPVLADAAAVRQILDSLATNAIEAMPRGGTLTLGASLEEGVEHVAATSEVRSRRHVRLTVADTGVGMDERTAARAFEPFFTTKPPGTGSGLGLSMVYGSARQLGGEVQIASVAWRGTTVSVCLPAAAAGPAAVRPAAAVRPHDAGAPLETILVAEDSVAVRNAAELVLARNGFRVVTASDGVEALEICRRHRGEIRLVLADLAMPWLDGIGLYEALEGEPARPRFLFTSGFAAPDGDATPAALGVPLIAKPWTAEQLVRAVREALASPAPAAPRGGAIG